MTKCRGCQGRGYDIDPTVVDAVTTMPAKRDCFTCKGAGVKDYSKIDAKGKAYQMRMKEEESKSYPEMDF